MKNYSEITKKLFKEGLSKNEIAQKLFEEGAQFSEIPGIFKESEIKFRRSNENTWKMKAARLFKANPEATADEMYEALGNSVKNPEYYVKAYYDMFKYIMAK